MLLQGLSHTPPRQPLPNFLAMLTIPYDIFWSAWFGIVGWNRESCLSPSWGGSRSTAGTTSESTKPFCNRYCVWVRPVRRIQGPQHRFAENKTVYRHCEWFQNLTRHLQINSTGLWFLVLWFMAKRFSTEGAVSIRPINAKPRPRPLHHRHESWERGMGNWERDGELGTGYGELRTEGAGLRTRVDKFSKRVGCFNNAQVLKCFKVKC